MKTLENNLDQFATDLRKSVAGVQEVSIEDCDGYVVIDVECLLCNLTLKSVCMEMKDVDYYDFLFSSIREIHDRMIDDLIENIFDDLVDKIFEGFEDEEGKCDDESCDLHKAKVSH